MASINRKKMTVAAASRWLPAASLLALAVAVPVVRGQQPNVPRVAYVYPAGGQQGTTVRVTVGGQFLDGVARVLISGRGLDARVVEHDRPMTPRQVNEARDRIDELRKRVNEPGVQRQILELQRQIADTLRRNRNPVLSEMVTVDVSIAADAGPGEHEIRLATPVGLSTPLMFVVGQLPEFREDDSPAAARTGTPITLPAVVNGRLIPGEAQQAQARLPQQRPGQPFTPGDADRYRFEARAGQQIVVSAAARRLRPYLADAVPGWLQATVALLDVEGHEVAYADDHRFHPDPVLMFRVPADSEYVLEIKDALYRGREDFVYRIAIGELPFITGIFPLGGPAGARTDVEVLGWNLPSAATTMDLQGRGAGVYPLAVRQGAFVSNVVPFAAGTLAEGREREPNDSTSEAQTVSLPVIVNGRIDRPGDQDAYRFTGRAGDAVVAEIVARRLDSPLDSVLELTDASGRRVGWNDDHQDAGAGLVTHHADSVISATLPADGQYVLRVRDVQGKGGPDYGYRLRLGAPQPDFELRLAPSAVNVNAGATVPLTVHAVRRDGFDGDIALALAGAPNGAFLAGAVVPAGQDQIRLTLTAPPQPGREPYAIRVEGRATIDGRTVVRQAVPADDMMQAFIYRHMVPADALTMIVTGRGGVGRAAAAGRAGGRGGLARFAVPQLVTIPAGGSARVRVALPQIPGLEELTLELSDPPDGITLRDLGTGAAGAEFTIEADAAKVKPGLRGNLLVSVSGERQRPATAQAPAARQRVPLGLLPAIPFEIVRR